MRGAGAADRCAFLENYSISGKSSTLLFHSPARWPTLSIALCIHKHKRVCTLRWKADDAFPQVAVAVGRIVTIRKF